MTITLTIDCLVYVYWLIENYVFVRIQELKVQQYYDYHERLAEMFRDCSQPKEAFENQSYQVESSIVSQPVLAPVVSMKPVAMQSELDEKAEGLFAELQLELGMDSDTAVEVEYEPIATYVTDEEQAEFDYGYEMVSLADYDESGQEFIEEGTYVTAYEDDLVDNQEDCIHMEDLMREEVVTSPSGYEAFASAKIIDNMYGPQQWVVSVIGMEEQYIHVSDGKRIWINVGERASKIHKNDVLILDIVRHGKEITVQNLVRVETSATDEYMIPDEERFLREEEDVRIAI
ncbi:hypothetical protein [Robertmurraya sp. FSL R5-0851]|uniref:hypothetical protein n=1 Tax=Robertmurraya sp. FSL R5-0851 TaxID=2921584 RepID=UPI0030F91D34